MASSTALSSMVPGTSASTSRDIPTTAQGMPVYGLNALRAAAMYSKKRKRDLEGAASTEAASSLARQSPVITNNTMPYQYGEELSEQETIRLPKQAKVLRAPPSDEELEEGEISEDEPDEASRIAEAIVIPPLQQQIRASLPTQPVVSTPPSSSSSSSPLFPQSGDRTDVTRASSRNPQLPLDLLQECTNLIEQLHSWGMTADYMLGQGLNKDLVLKIFVEKGLKLPPHHLNSYLSRQNERAAAAATVAAASSPSVSTILPVSSDVRIPPDSSSMISTEPVLRMGSIIPVPVPVSAPAFQTQHLTHTLPRTPQQAVRQISVPLATSLIDLSEKEAKAREALLARKAEVNRRNAEKAQTFMNAQLSNLLVGKPEPGAEGMSGTNGTLEGEDIEMHALVDLKRGSLDNTFSEQLDFTNHVSEAKIQETREKLVTLEDDASQIVCKIPSSDHDTQEAAGDDLSTIRLDENSSTSYRRPVAFDFESEPTQALPNVPRWSAHLATSSRAREFVIELSDHEDSEDDSDTEELRAAVSETKQQDHPSSGSSFTSLSRAPPNGIRKQVSPSSENPQVSSLSDQGSLASSSLDTRGQLEAKQAEIKKMMDMINRLEGKKKIGHKSGSRAGTPLTPATLRDTSLFDATELSPAPQSAPVVSDISTPVAATALRHAKAAVGRLLEERRELVEEAIRVEKDDENADFMDPIDIPVNMQAQQDAAVAQLQEAATEDREKLLSTGTAGFENDNSRLGSKEALIDQAYTSSRPDGETPFGSALQISGRPEGPKSRQEFLEVEETLTNDGLSDMQDDKDTDIDEELISANGRS